MKPIFLSDSFYPLLKVSLRYLVLCGGAGSGKTEFAARKLYVRAQKEGNHRFLCLRKVRTRVKESIVEVVIRMLNEVGQPFEYNRSDRTITIYNRKGQKTEFLFDGLDDPEKIKSIKGLTGIWLEEATEFTERDFLQLNLRLREPSPYYKQIILSFNPDEEKAPWIKRMFFDHTEPDAFVHVSTVEDNPIDDVRKNYLKQLDALEAQDPAWHSIYRLGKWAVARGKIYNWPVDPLPAIGRWDEVFYGGDFGYTVDPAAVVRIYRKANSFWLEEVIYQTGLTNADLGAMMKEKGIDRRPFLYFDSAEPKSIEEITRMGFNVTPSAKGPDSVRAGIDYIKSLDVHIVPGSENIIKEASGYKWREDKDGNLLSEPVKYRDHLMDAIRYGIYTHMKITGAFFGVIKQNVMPE
jgi:phage terminase large subunit